MRLMLVGGFLGAGKTTLLWETAKRLAGRGEVVGLITNDQAPDLVDTALLRGSGAQVREVAGSCFCCNFDGFRDAVQSLIEAGATCIVAEPVGSCTDLSATIVQPLKKLWPSIRVAPLAVLVDPARVRETLRNSQATLHADAIYILRKQLEEADQILVNKSDTVSAEEREELLGYLAKTFSHARIGAISALTGDGVDEWLDDALQDRTSGTQIADVDYDRYANGEAVLGWLNAVVDVRWAAVGKHDGEGLVARFMDALRDNLRTTKSDVGHIKVLLNSPGGQVRSNLTGLSHAVYLRRDGAFDDETAVLIVNARVQISPAGIEEVFRSSLSNACSAVATPTVRTFYCLKPGRPTPTYRYNAVVGEVS